MFKIESRLRFRTDYFSLSQPREGKLSKALKLILETEMNNFLFLITIALFGFFLQYERLFAVGGINPNITLIVLLLLVFSFKRSGYFFSLLAVLLTVAALWGYFWFGKIVLVFGLALAIKLLKDNFTGDVFFDFLLSVTIGTMVFYGAIGLFSRSALPELNIIFFEVIYNVLFGLFYWLVFSGFIRKVEKSIS